MQTVATTLSTHAQHISPPRIGLFALPILLTFAGCATVPAPLQGTFAPLSPEAATQQDATGQAVRWGGTIAVVESLSGQTCFQLVGRPLDTDAQPTSNDRAAGRFIACHDGFYEPQIFAKGRSMTVTGHIVGYDTRKVGEYDYRQPKVAADVIYLWPKQREIREINTFFDPYPYPLWAYPPWYFYPVRSHSRPPPPHK
ncbi:MAG: Slp family lipoprotein [Lysobacteraceae bacterium]